MANEVTCYTILSRDVELLNWCVVNTRRQAGMEHKWLLIHWVNQGQTEKEIAGVRSAAEYLGMDYRQWVAPPESLGQFGGDRTKWFLHNLYACWNLGYEAARTEWVARLGSDQFFSDGWLGQLMRQATQRGEDGVYHCHTVESPVARHSRHPVGDFGSTWQEFQRHRFDTYVEEHQTRWAHMPAIKGAECGLYYNHPVRGQQERPDGCTWLQTRALWERFGPMEDHLTKERVTGDVAYMDRMYDAGVQGWLVPGSVTYHLVRGESRDTQV